METNVEFDEDKADNTTIYETRSSGLNALVQKMGLAKSEKSANLILIIMTIICFLAAIGVYVYFFTSLIRF